MLAIRNFCIIAHIDHGKSTLADRFLELTGTVKKDNLIPQYLDRLNLEREHGITIKMHPVRMIYSFEGLDYILNLIDTPGHVDFSYEVSRSLAAVEGAILLVDASQGIEAQTITHLEMAKEQNLKIIPVLNKIDLPYVDLEKRKTELSALLNIKPEEISLISAKTGKGVKELLERVIKEIPTPLIKSGPGRALIFDSHYDPYQGVIAYVRVFEGQFLAKEKIYLLAHNQPAEIVSLGIFKPELQKTEKLEAGEIGFIATGLKDLNLIRPGETICHLREKNNVLPLAGYQEPKPLVFASFYPANQKDYESFKEAILKLKLTDSSLSYEIENSDILGKGFRLGFLGLLHLEITQERLSREYALSIITTEPLIPYHVYLKNNPAPLTIINPSDFPTPDQILKCEEPWMKVKISSPPQYLSAIIKMLNSYRGFVVAMDNLREERVLITAEMPFKELFRGLENNLKSQSNGYAILEYSLLDYRPVDLEKLEVYLTGEHFKIFDVLIERERLQKEARQLALILKDILPAQSYPLIIQIKHGGKILSRETISALKKNVTYHLYGGDRSRKVKLWEKQKKGKRRLSQYAKLNLSSDVYLKLIKTKQSSHYETS